MELIPHRQTNHNVAAYLLEHLQFDDPYDSRLHEAAKQMFQEQLEYVKLTKNMEI